MNYGTKIKLYNILLLTDYVEHYPSVWEFLYKAASPTRVMRVLTSCRAYSFSTTEPLFRIELASLPR